MKHFNSIILLISTLLLLSSLGQAQSLTGPTVLCSGSGGTYYFSDDIPGLTAYWYQDGNYLGTGMSKSMNWYSTGSINVDVNNSSGYLYSVGLNVDVKTPGYISAPSQVCSGQLFNLSRSGSVGNSFTWRARPASGGSWTTLGTGTTISNYSITQNTYFEVVLNDCASNNIASHTVNLYPTQTGGTIQAPVSVICYGTSVGDIYLTVNPVGQTSSYQWQQSSNGSTWSNISGATSFTYNPGAISASTYFRRNTTGCFVTASSNAVYVQVDPTTIAGTLTFQSSHTTCVSGTANLQISGAVGVVTNWNYRYKDGSAGSWSAWTSFSTANQSTNTLAITSGSSIERYYEFSVTVKSGVCSAVTGNVVSTIMYPATVAGNATVTGPLEAFGSTSGNIGVANAVGIITQYHESFDGVTWVNRGTAAYNISQIVQYRVQVQSGTCTTQNSAPITVYTYGVPSILVQGGTSLLPGTTVTLSVGRYYTYQWIKDNVDIAGATASSYVTSEPGAYRVRVTGKQGTTIGSYTSQTVTLSATFPSSSAINAATVTNYYKAGLTATQPPTHGYKAEEVRQSVNYMDGLGRTIQQVAVAQSPTRKDLIVPTAYDKYSQSPKQYLPYAQTYSSGAYDAFAVKGAIGGTYANSSQYQFYQTAAKVARDTVPYSRISIEASPLQRGVEQAAPGSDWRIGTGHTIRSQFNVINSANTDAALKNVKIFNLNGPTGATYANNELGAAVTTDENNNKVWTIVDKMGRTILKRVQIDETFEGQSLSFLETYYVYDVRGNLAIQIPPKASAKLLSAPGSWSPTFRDEWCFIYTYDQRNRLTEKKVPDSSAPVYYAYDRFDRLILTQDGNLRTTNKWLFLKYDYKGRPVITGIYQNTTHTTLAAVQTNVLDVLYTSSDPVNYNGLPFYEERGTAMHGYTNQSFPTTVSEVYSINYYDSYDFDFSGTDDYSYTAQTLTNEGSQSTAFGLATGSKRLVLGTSNWLYTYQFYDKYGRVIQVRSNNHLSLTADNLTTVTYNFDGTTNTTKTYHNGGGSNSVTITNRYLYDHSGRILQVKQKINSNAEVNVVSYQYNELGQMVEKNLHCTSCPDADPLAGLSGTTSGSANVTMPPYNNQLAVIATNSITMQPGFQVNGTLGNFTARIGYTQAQAAAMASTNSLQSVDYRYNIRGWLTSINNAALSNDGTVNDDASDYFGMELNYNTAASGIGNTLQYNGNISSITWKAAGEAAGNNGRRSYKYTYDKSDRLKTATFQMYGTTTWDKEVNTLNETMGYDANGNILALTRNMNQRGNSGITITSTPVAMDNLTYTYDAGKGNRLAKVEDSGLTTGFNNGSTAADEYIYDTNGSVTKDRNKGIDVISYNLLGKPQQITFLNGRVINYTYDAAGTKLKMAVTLSGVTTTTDYIGNFVYQNNALSFFGSPEGRVVKNGSSYEYQYALADHQGNTRVLFTSATPAPVATSTNLEAATNSNFQNYTNRVGFDLMDHTDAGTTYTYAQKLTGGYNAQVGVAKSYKVYAGDKVKIEAWGKYTNPTSTNSNIAGFASALFAAFGVPAPAGGETGTISSALNIWGGLVAGGTGGSNPSGPKAFVNIIVFDKNYKLLDASWDGISTAANQVGATPVIPHEYMMQEYTIKEEGYVFMYVSNENATLVDVYFDDITMTHTKGNIIQYNEYYPFGMQTANSWTRENNTGNNFLYNESTELNTSTGYYDLFFRNFDPALGRFMQVDPLASKYHNQSTYQYGNNDPVFWTDPSGAGGDEAKRAFDRADAAFASLNSLAGGGTLSGVYGASWNFSTYGSSGGVGGSAFSRYGPGDGGALQAFSAYMAAGSHAAARRRDGITFSIDFSSMQDGYHNLNFISGIYSFISSGTIMNNLGLYRQVFGLSSWISSARQNLLQSNFGNFATKGPDGSLMIPYTGSAYSPSITSIRSGADNSWRTPWLFLDGFLHPELANASTSLMSGSGASSVAGSFMLATEGSLWVDSKIAIGTYYTSAATQRSLATQGKNLVKQGGKYVGYAGAGFTLVEGLFDGNGLSWGDGVKVGLGVLSVVTPFGWVYGTIDFGIGIYSGTSITDRIGAGIDYSNKYPK